MKRTCTKCGVEHPVEFFNKDRTRADGVYPQCKDCTRGNCRRVYSKYHDKHIALKQRWKDGTASGVGSTTGNTGKTAPNGGARQPPATKRNCGGPLRLGSTARS